MDDTKFKETEKKYKELKDKHAKGEISTEIVKASLKQLMIQDELGTYWMLGGKSGKWYKHDGAQWLEADPYLEFSSVEEPPFELNKSSQVEDRKSDVEIQSTDEDQSSFLAQSMQSEKDQTEYIEETEASEVSYPSFSTEKAEEKIESEEAEKAEEPYKAEMRSEAENNQESFQTQSVDESANPFITDVSDVSDISYTPYATETTGNSETAADIEVGDISQPFGNAETIEKSSETNDRQFLSDSDSGDVTENPFLEEQSENGTTATYEENQTYELDSSEKEVSHDSVDNQFFDNYQLNAEEEEKKVDMGISQLDIEENISVEDTQKFEYTVHKGEDSEVPFKQEFREQVIGKESKKTEKPVEPKTESPDQITCGICQSRIPPYAVFCSFCGANQKTLKQRATMKPIKVESELLVKSVKPLSFLFFLGLIGMILGVILGGTFGVIKTFMVEVAPHLPLVLSELRGGVIGGLVFAAACGIGGFFAAAILSLVLSGIYNLAASISGGIRFKVKR